MSEPTMPGEFVDDGIHYCAWTNPGTLDAMSQLQLDAQDVVIVTYLKTGSTWMQEILSALHDRNIMTTDKPDWIYYRSPQLEDPLTTRTEVGTEHVANIMNTPSPRFVKTHLRPKYFNTGFLKAGGPKVILMWRNPKDTLVSYYHYNRHQPVLGSYQGSWHEFLEERVKPKKLYAGDWADLLMEWCDVLKGRPNVLRVSYEDMKKDIRKVIKEVADFCKVDASGGTVEQVARYTSFDNMDSSDVHGFEQLEGGLKETFTAENVIRKGVVGDWKNYFSDEENAYIAERCQEVEEKTGLSFEFEI